jgi:nitrilase
MARENGVFLVTGVTERDAVNGSLYCTMLYLSPTHGYLGRHRKIKPTGVERLVWAEGHGADVLTTVPTELGRLGGLICWENYMPLARWPSISRACRSTSPPRPTPATPGPPPCSTLPAKAAASCWAATSSSAATITPTSSGLGGGRRGRHLPGRQRHRLPAGKIRGGPLWDEAGVLVAELDLDEVIASKLDFDVIGHYTRPTCFIRGQKVGNLVLLPRFIHAFGRGFVEELLEN